MVLKMNGVMILARIERMAGMGLVPGSLWKGVNDRTVGSVPVGMIGKN